MCRGQLSLPRFRRHKSGENAGESVSPSKSRDRSMRPRASTRGSTASGASCARPGLTARREARPLGIVQRSWTRSTPTTSRATACRSATGARGRDGQCSRRLTQNPATSSEAAGPKKHQRWRCRRMSHWGPTGRREMSTGLRNGLRPSPFTFPVVYTKLHKTVSRRVTFWPSRSFGVLGCPGAAGRGWRSWPCALSAENKPLARKNTTGRRWAFRSVFEAGEGDRAFAKRTPADPGHCAAGAARRSIATKRTAAKKANGREAVPPARAL